MGMGRQSSPTATVLAALLLPDVYWLLLDDVYFLFARLALSHLRRSQAVSSGLGLCIAHRVGFQRIGQERVYGHRFRFVMEADETYVTHDEYVEGFLIFLLRLRQIDKAAHALYAERIQLVRRRIVKFNLFATPYLPVYTPYRVVLILDHKHCDGVIHQFFTLGESIEAPQEAVSDVET